MSESEIKLEICQFLERFPELILFTITPPKRTKYSSKFMRHGWPDISGVVREKIGITIRPFFVEVKKPGGTISLEQHQILERAKEWGAITCIATSVNDVRQALRI